MRRQVVRAGAVAAFAGAVGCAALLSLDDVDYRARLDAASDAPLGIDGGPDAQPRGRCTPDGAIVFANFEQGATTSGYRNGQLASVFTEQGPTFFFGQLRVDDDASVSPTHSLEARGGVAYVEVPAAAEWLQRGFEIEGDLLVSSPRSPRSDAAVSDADIPDATATAPAALMGIQFHPPEAGFFDPNTLRAALYADVTADGGLAFRFEVSGDGGPFSLPLGGGVFGTWTHARLTFVPRGSGYAVAMTLNEDASTELAPAVLDREGYIGWGVLSVSSWTVRVDNACVRY